MAQHNNKQKASRRWFVLPASWRLQVGMAGLFVLGLHALSIGVGTMASSTTAIVNDTTIGTGLNQWQYAGSWQYYNDNPAKYQNDDHGSTTTGSTATLRFHGTQVRYYGTKTTSHGTAAISIDGGTETMVSLYAPTRSDDQLLYTSPELPNGSHTLTIRVAGVAGAGGGTGISVDRADVIGLSGGVAYDVAEAENGLLSGGAAALADSSASNSQAVTFGAAPNTFTFVVIPDTQHMVTSASRTNMLKDTLNYVAANKTARNIAFVMHMGDIVNTPSSTTEWGRAVEAMDIIDASGIPYSLVPGNHDVDPVNTGAVSNNYHNNFGLARFAGKPWYGGSGGTNFDDFLPTSGTKRNANNYSLFSAGGMNFIQIGLNWFPDANEVDWADALMKQYSNRRAIVVSHCTLTFTGAAGSGDWCTAGYGASGYNGQQIYNALSDNPNMFLMLGGHMDDPEDGSNYRRETRSGMQPVHLLLTDYQDSANGGGGYVRFLAFNRSANQVTSSVCTNAGSNYTCRNADTEAFSFTYQMTP